MEVAPCAQPSKCLQGKHSWMNDFLRLYDRAGHDVAHQQEFAQRTTGSDPAAAVGS